MWPLLSVLFIECLEGAYADPLGLPGVGLQGVQTPVPGEELAAAAHEDSHGREALLVQVLREVLR